MMTQGACSGSAAAPATRWQQQWPGRAACPPTAVQREESAQQRTPEQDAAELEARARLPQAPRNPAGAGVVAAHEALLRLRLCLGVHPPAERAAGRRPPAVHVAVVPGTAPTIPPAEGRGDAAYFGAPRVRAGPRPARPSWRGTEPVAPQMVESNVENRLDSVKEDTSRA